MIFFLLSAFLVLAGLVIFFQFREIRRWQQLYLAQKDTFQSREDHFLNLALTRNNLRPTTLGFTPENTIVETKAPPPRESESDDLRIQVDRVKERMELGIIDIPRGLSLIKQIQSGELTQAELDLELWPHPQSFSPPSEEIEF